MSSSPHAEGIAIISRDDVSFSRGMHSHACAQLIYAVDGVVSVGTANGTWVVPHNRAVWVPAGVSHETRSYGAVRFRSLFVTAPESNEMPQDCTVVQVTSLLRELILKLDDLSRSPKDSEYTGLVTRLLLREMAFIPAEPLCLPSPRHKRLSSFCLRIRDTPDRAITLEEAAAALNMSRSSFMRLFKRELGMSFAQWRLQARLLHALVLLADGQPVLSTALACGYDSPSAFSAMFRKTLGQTPSSYFLSSAGDFAPESRGP